MPGASSTLVPWGILGKIVAHLRAQERREGSRLAFLTSLIDLAVGVGMLRGRGFLGFLVSWFLDFLVSWFLGLLVSWFLGFLVSWLLGFSVSWFLGFLVSWFLGFLTY